MIPTWIGRWCLAHEETRGCSVSRSQRKKMLILMQLLLLLQHQHSLLQGAEAVAEVVTEGRCRREDKEISDHSILKLKYEGIL